jgi:hypothetical protein
MKVTHERLVGPEFMVPAMRVTRGKDMYTKKLPSLDAWYTMLISEHSSHRAVKYRIYVEDIPFYTHVHLVRHHVGFEPHVYSQRDDNGIQETTPRDDYPQGTLISMFFDANVQAILNISRKRLCHKAHRTAQQFVQKLKYSLIYTGDDYDKMLGKLLLQPCSWFPGICQEPEPCGRVANVTKLADMHRNLLNEVKNESI